MQKNELLIVDIQNDFLIKNDFDECEINMLTQFYTKDEHKLKQIN